MALVSGTKFTRNGGKWEESVRKTRLSSAMPTGRGAPSSATAVPHSEDSVIAKTWCRCDTLGESGSGSVHGQTQLCVHTRARGRSPSARRPCAPGTHVQSLRRVSPHPPPPSRSRCARSKPGQAGTQLLLQHFCHVAVNYLMD